MRRSLILDVVVRLVFHSALLLGLFLLFTGHNRPGGGFVGGLVVGAALALRYVAGGIDEVRATLPTRPWTLLGTGLATATLTALLPLVFGRELMEHAKLDAHLGPLGAFHLNTALFFDIGVFTLVVGSTMLILTGIAHQSVRSHRYNNARAAEEAQGRVRWLRPDFQNPQNSLQKQELLPQEDKAPEADFDSGKSLSKPEQSKPPQQPWPAQLPDQVRAVAAVLATSPTPLQLPAVEARFKGRGPWKKGLPTLLQTLEALGRAQAVQIDGVAAWRRP